MKDAILSTPQHPLLESQVKSRVQEKSNGQEGKSNRMRKEKPAQKDVLSKLHENTSKDQHQDPKAEQTSIKWDDKGLEVDVIHGKGACLTQTVVWK